MVAESLRAWNDGASMNDPVAGLVLPTPVIASSVPAVIVSPRKGTARKMYARITVAPGVGEVVILTLYKNAAATALTVTFAAGQTERSDLVNSVAVAVGDKLQIVIVALTSMLDPQACRLELELA